MDDWKTHDVGAYIFRAPSSWELHVDNNILKLTGANQESVNILSMQKEGATLEQFAGFRFGSLTHYEYSSDSAPLGNGLVKTFSFSKTLSPKDHIFVSFAGKDEDYFFGASVSTDQETFSNNKEIYFLLFKSIQRK